MVDITQYNDGNALVVDEVNTGGNSLEPGRYIMHYAGDEIIKGKNGWEAIKMSFEIDGSTITLDTTFTMKLEGDDPVKSQKAMEIGDRSLKLLLKAMGVTSTKNTDELVGKSVSGQLIRDPDNERYLKIDQNYGKNWQPVEEAKAPTPAAKPVEENKEDDLGDKIPF
jgi:hypothetical protein